MEHINKGENNERKKQKKGKNCNYFLSKASF